MIDNHTMISSGNGGTIGNFHYFHLQCVKLEFGERNGKVLNLFKVMFWGIVLVIIMGKQKAKLSAHWHNKRK